MQQWGIAPHLLGYSESKMSKVNAKSSRFWFLEHQSCYGQETDQDHSEKERLELALGFPRLPDGLIRGSRVGTTPLPPTQNLLLANPAGRGLVCAGSGRQQPESQTWGVPQSAGRGGPRRQKVRVRGQAAGGWGSQHEGPAGQRVGAWPVHPPPHSLAQGGGD